MRFGTKCPDGFLPVFSVGDEEEAKALISLSCSTNLAGEYIAQELAEEQSLDNLERFSTRLDEAHDRLISTGSCRCATEEEA